MIRVMNMIGATGGLREQRMVQTRQDIIDSLLRLLEQEHPTEVSMPSVAAESGVSLRTLYRYFPTKTALIDEASKWMNQLASPGASEYGDVDVDNLAELLTRQWSGFDTHVAGIRAQHMSAAGRELRQHRLEKTRTAAEVALDALELDPTPEDRARIVDAAIAIGSSSMYLELVDRMGHDSSDAADLAGWVVEAMFAHFASTRTTRPADPTPT